MRAISQPSGKLHWLFRFWKTRTLLIIIGHFQNFVLQLSCSDYCRLSICRCQMLNSKRATLLYEKLFFRIQFIYLHRLCTRKYELGQSSWRHLHFSKAFDKIDLDILLRELFAIAVCMCVWRLLGMDKFLHYKRISGNSNWYVSFRISPNNIGCSPGVSFGTTYI